MAVVVVYLMHLHAVPPMVMTILPPRPARRRTLVRVLVLVLVSSGDDDAAAAVALFFFHFVVSEVKFKTYSYVLKMNYCTSCIVCRIKKFCFFIVSESKKIE